MALVNQTYIKSKMAIPTPIVTLGKAAILQHSRAQDISSIDTTLANDNIRIGISFSSGDWTEFFANKPMIFMELLGNQGQPINQMYRRGDNKSKGYYHPDNFGGALNRTITYYGGGKSPLNKLITEWDVNPALYKNINYNYTQYFQDQIIEIDQKQFYRSTGITLPVRKVDWHLQPSIYGLKKLNPRGIYTNGNNVVTSYKQPVVFYYACIDPKNPKNVLFSEPSQEVIIYPKGGEFVDGDYYYYDWTVDYGR